MIDVRSCALKLIILDNLVLENWLFRDVRVHGRVMQRVLRSYLVINVVLHQMAIVALFSSLAGRRGSHSLPKTLELLSEQLSPEDLTSWSSDMFSGSFC